MDSQRQVSPVGIVVDHKDTHPGLEWAPLS
jgi:hypothetical protein